MTSAKLIEKAMGPQSGAFAGGTATVITGFFLKPMYESFKKAVDKRLTPPTLDLSDEFPEFEPDVRSRLTVPGVVTALVEHASALFDVIDSAVYPYHDGNLVLQSARGFGGASADVAPDADAIATLRQGKAARPEPNDDAPVYVPIVVLGRRDGEKGYSQLEVAALEALGRKGGMALYLSESRIATAAGAPARIVSLAESS